MEGREFQESQSGENLQQESEDVEIQNLLNGQWTMNGNEINKVQKDGLRSSSDLNAGLQARLILSSLSAIPRSVWNSGPYSIAVAAFIYSITLLSVKLISDDVQIFQILITRSLVSLIISLFVSWRNGVKPLYGKFKHFHILFGRAFFGSIAFMSFYYSVALLPLGDATAIFFLNGASTAVLGWLVLGQTLQWLGVAGIMCSIAGVMFVAHPPFLFGGDEDWGSQRIMGVFLGLFSSVMAAGAFVMVRLIGKRESSVTIALWFHTASLTGIIPVIMGYPRAATLPNAFQCAMLTVISLGSFCAQLMLTRGFQQDNTSKIAAINYLQVAFGYVWGLLILGDAFTWYGILGALMIAAGVVLVNKQPKDRENISQKFVTDISITDCDLQLFDTDTMSEQGLSFQMTRQTQENTISLEDGKNIQVEVNENEKLIPDQNYSSSDGEEINVEILTQRPQQDSTSELTTETLQKQNSTEIKTDTELIQFLGET